MVRFAFVVCLVARAGALADLELAIPDNRPEAWAFDKTFSASGGKFNPNMFATS